MTRVLYVTSNVDSVIEHKILQRLHQDSEIEIELATCESRALYPAIQELGIPVHRYMPWLHLDFPVARRLTFHLRHKLFSRFLRRLADSRNVDVMHAGWMSADAYDAVCSGFRPVLARSWGSDVLNNPSMRTPHTSGYLRERVRHTARLADAIYSDCDHVAQTIVRLAEVPREKIYVFPQFGADTDLFRPDAVMREEGRRRLGVQDDDIVLFNIRTFKPVYGIEDLIRAMVTVVATESRALLVLLGRGPLESRFKSLAKELGIAHRVRFVGGAYIPTEELPIYYNAGDVYVSTSLSDGSSLSLIEAMACGLPVAVTDVPSICEWIEDGKGGRIFPRGQPEEIATGLIEILAASNQDRKKMGGINRDIAVARGDAAQNYEKLVDLYNLLKKVPNPSAHESASF